jgi:hypothetical protein
VQEIVRLIGYDSKDEAYLKEATLAMMHCIVEWDVLDKDGSEIWGAAVLLASVQITHGVCSGVVYSWGRAGIAADIRYTFGTP